EALEFKRDAAQPDQRLPAEWGARLSAGPLPLIVGTTPEDHPPAVSTVGLQIDRSELGQLSLRYQLGISAGAGMSFMEPPDPLAVGQSPSVAKPDNAGANRALRADPL